MWVSSSAAVRVPCIALWPTLLILSSTRNATSPEVIRMSWTFIRVLFYIKFHAALKRIWKLHKNSWKQKLSRETGNNKHKQDVWSHLKMHMEEYITLESRDYQFTDYLDKLDGKLRSLYLLFLQHSWKQPGNGYTCPTSHVEMLHPRKGIQLGDKPERKQTKFQYKQSWLEYEDNNNKKKRQGQAAVATCPSTAYASRRSWDRSSGRSWKPRCWKRCQPICSFPPRAPACTLMKKDRNFRISASQQEGVVDAYRSWWRGSGGRPPPEGCIGPEPERAGGGVLGGWKTQASLRPVEPSWSPSCERGGAAAAAPAAAARRLLWRRRVPGREWMRTRRWGIVEFLWDVGCCLWQMGWADGWVHT